MVGWWRWDQPAGDAAALARLFRIRFDDEKLWAGCIGFFGQHAAVTWVGDAVNAIIGPSFTAARLHVTTDSAKRHKSAEVAVTARNT